MEAIGAVASITAIVDISQKIIEWTAEYTKRVAHASSEIRALSNGLSTLNRVLLDLQGRNSGHIFSSLTDTLDQCYQNIAKVAQTLNIGKGVRKAVQSLLWPFRQKEIQEFLEKLSRYLQLFTIALAGDQRSLTVDIRGLIVDGMTISNDIRDVVKRMEPLVLGTSANPTNLQHLQYISQKNEILQWLLKVNYNSSHNTASRNRGPGTGKWFIQGYEFHCWLEDDKNGARPPLWLSGIVGTGKTVFMSIIINYATSHLGKPRIGTEPEHQSDIGVAFFYIDFNDTAKQSTTIMLLSFIRQLVQQLNIVPAIVSNLKRDTPIGELPDVEDLLSCLAHLSQLFQRCFFFIDALDEADPVEDALKALVQITTLLPRSTRLLVTSRDEFQIKQPLLAANFQQIPIPRTKVDNDIRSYITGRSEGDLKERFDSFPIQLRKEVVDSLTQQAQGMFLWARWQLNEICLRKTETEVRTALTRLPKTLNETYRRIIQQIDPEHLKWARRALLWLVSALIPMNLDTLHEALTVDLEVFEVKPEERLLDRHLILEICRSLITLQDDRSIALAHLSLKQFLVLPEAADFFMDKNSIHMIAAKACFAYMTCGRFNPSSWKEGRGLDRFKKYQKERKDLSFLRYCCTYAFEHLNQEPYLVLHSSEPLLEVFRRQDLRMHLYQSFRFLEQNLSCYRSESTLAKMESTLPFGPAAGGEPADARNYGSLELSWNSSPISRFIAVDANAHARVLVDSDLGFLEEDEQGWSALSFAAAYEDRETLGQMLKILDSSEVSHLKPLGTALIAAVASRASASVHALTGRLYPNSVSVSPDLYFLRGINMILCAVIGDESLLQLFLDTHVPENGPESAIDDEALQVALVAAASAGHPLCVSEICSRGTQAKVKPSPGRYQAIWDAKKSQLFSAANALWQSRPKPQETSSLSWRRSEDKLADMENAMTAAAIPRIPGILTILTIFGVDNLCIVPDFEKKELYSYVDKEEAGDMFSPIEPIFERILQNNSGLLGKSPYLDQALLWCASVNDRLGLLEKLLEAGADPNSLSNTGAWTALLLAIDCGCLESLKLLLSHGADPNVRAYCWPLGSLDAAIGHGYKKLNKAVLHELLSAGADVNYDVFGERNPVLFKASLLEVIETGSPDDPGDATDDEMAEYVVHALLEHGPDPNALAVEGLHGSALIAACATCNTGLARLLLTYGASVDIEVKCGNYGSALIAAARHGNVELVELMLQQNPNLDSAPLHLVKTEDEDGSKNEDERQESLLIAAVVGGNIDVIKCLLDYSKSANINQVVESNRFGTPLIAAAYRGDFAITDLLLRSGAAVDLEGHQKSSLYRIAPVTAILELNEDVAGLLLAHVSPISLEKNSALWATALVACVVKDNRVLIDLLLSVGVPLNVSCEFEDSEFSEYAYPLIAAARTENLTIYNLLVAHGASKDVSHAGKYGDCLTAAAVSGNLDFVTMLLDAGANPSSINPHRQYWSAFIAVALESHPEIFRALVKKGGKPDVFYDYPPQDFPDKWIRMLQTTKNGIFSALAIKRSWSEGHMMLRSSDIEDVETHLDLMYGHPLIAAIFRGTDEMVDLFLDHECNVNLVAKTGYSRTPLIAAVCTSRWDIARNFLERGANPLQPVPHDNYGSAVIAASHGEDFDKDIDIDIFQELGLSLEALQTVPDCIHGSLLIAASSTPKSIYRTQARDLDFVKALLEEGCKPQDIVKGSLYGCALIAAASEVRIDFLEEFVKYGFDMKKRTEEGIFGYPLLAAIARKSRIHKKYHYNYEEEEKKFKFVRRLLELGADPDVSFNNRTPLMLVMEEVRNFDEEIAVALLKHGANANTVLARYAVAATPDDDATNELCSALSIAAERGKHSLVNLLLKHGGDPRLLPASYKICDTETVD